MDNTGTKCLVPKINEETEFLAALGEFLKIAKGTLGWEGHARMIMEIDKGGEVYKALQIAKPEGTEEEKVAQLKEWLQGTFWESILQHAEWVDKETGETRWKALRILYGTDDKTEA